ncbi:MAG: hypothetical protein MJ010_02375 [Paludibacteraceae bacterium]|nr:hypothetical protein [Paludibacteraceae bacterium]
MKLDLLDIKDGGIVGQQRVVMVAYEDCDLGHYMLAITQKMSENSFSSKLSTIKWLNNIELKKGDIVVVYFKGGETKSKKNDSGSITYFLYWDIEKTFQDFSNSCCVLLETTWVAKDIQVDSKEGDNI